MRLKTISQNHIDFRRFIGGFVAGIFQREGAFNAQFQSTNTGSQATTSGKTGTATPAVLQIGQIAAIGKAVDMPPFEGRHGQRVRR